MDLRLLQEREADQIYNTWGQPVSRGQSGVGRILQNFVFPWNTGTAGRTELDGEVLRLYEATGDEGVFPRKADWSVTYGGQTKDLSNEEYSAYQKQMGELSYDIAQGLFDNQSYLESTDEERAKMLKDAYDYANAVAKEELVGYELDSWMKKAQQAQEKGIALDDYIAARNRLSGYESTEEESGTDQFREELLADASLTAKQKAELDKLLTGTKEPPDYTDEDAFMLSFLGDSAQQAYEKLAGKISVERFVECYDLVRSVEGTKGRDGKTISGSLKQNRYNLLIEEGMTPKGARTFLTEVYGYKW